MGRSPAAGRAPAVEGARGVRRLPRPGTLVYGVARPDGVASRVPEPADPRRDVPVYDGLPEAGAA
ncbi:hypothetical protein [Streptomyces sp. SAI-229]|uniref:hypothetical protein n=1 Tax=Streptomyces sp. SAI-229 TaxID=3377731 RepID=UPI003C7B5FE5